MTRHLSQLVRNCALIAGLTLAAPAVAAAQPPAFELPLDCTPGQTCWIVNYVDLDPTDGVRDYACGIATYNMAPRDAHSGTDFSVGTLARMEQGVAVFAAAGGRVIGVRDGVPDVSISEAGAASVANRECGNGVRIDNGDGWTTQYCHMRKGSIAVRTGDQVTQGQKLGDVGLSGMTEFPHLHFQVEKDGTVIDPFVGAPRDTAVCGLGEHPLWQPSVLAELPYEPTALYLAGFASGAPSVDQVRAGDPGITQLTPAAPALVLWTDMYNVRAGDTLTMRIQGPNGVIFENSQTIDKNQARQFVYGGRKRPPEGWPAGTYTGEIRLLRASDPNRGEVISVDRTLVVR